MRTDRQGRRGASACGLLIALVALAVARGAEAFDHTHAAWTAVLADHVRVSAGGQSSVFDYAALARRREGLDDYLADLSRVPAAEFDGWSAHRRLAFLVNAYNAFTIAKVLTRYPDLQSIRDFGTVFGNPWKDRFFVLLGRRMSLDDLEHGLIRAPGAFEDPRIHFAVNCASVGCPMLREEAYDAGRLDAQLDEQVARFLSDRGRNRHRREDDVLEISPLFDWYREDFERGWHGHVSVRRFLAQHAQALALDATLAGRLAAGEIRIEYGEYDWRLNDVPH